MKPMSNSPYPNMKTRLPHLVLVLASLVFLMSVPSALAVVFTSNTLIQTNDLTYEGQDIVVNSCTVTINGAHAFNSLIITNGGVVTHPAAPNGEPTNRLDLTIATDVYIGTNSAVDVSGKGYGSAGGSGCRCHGQRREWSAGAGYGGDGGGPVRVAAGGAAYGVVDGPVACGQWGGASLICRLPVRREAERCGWWWAGSCGWTAVCGPTDWMVNVCQLQQRGRAVRVAASICGWARLSGAGSGVIQANGGESTNNWGRRRGRRAHCGVLQQLTITAGSGRLTAGTGYAKGGAGTMYLQRPMPVMRCRELILDDGGTTTGRIDHGEQPEPVAVADGAGRGQCAV